MSYSILYKDPTEIINVTVDWTQWLGGDTITSSSWTIAPGLTTGATTNNTTSATVWLDGGVLGDFYQITNTIVTAGGRRTNRTFVVRITDK